MSDNRAGVLGFIGLAGLFSIVFIADYQYVPPVEVALLDTGSGQVALQWDNGMGFNHVQEREMPGTWRQVVALPDASASPVLLLAEGAPPPSPRLASRVASRISGHVTLVRDPGAAVAVWELADCSRLRGVARRIDDEVVALEASPPGGRCLAVLWNANGGAMLAITTAVSYFDFLPSRGDGTVGLSLRREAPRNPVSLLALTARGKPQGSVVDLASESETATIQLDLTPFRQRTKPVLLLVQVSLAVALAATITLAGRRAWRFSRKEDRREHLATWVQRRRTGLAALAFLAACQGFWLVGHWPGFFGWDSGGAYYQATTLSYNPWYSVSHGLIGLAVLQIGGPWVLSVAQTALTALLGAATAQLADDMKAPRWAIGVTVLALGLSPVVGTYSSFHTRDVLCGILMAGLLTASFAIALSPSARVTLARTLEGRLVLFVSIVVLVLLRSEAALTLGGAALAVAVAWRAERRRILASVGACIVAAVVLNAVLQRALVADLSTWKSRYTVSVLINPICAIYSRRHYSPSPERDTRILSEVIDPEECRSNSDPYSINFWPGRGGNCCTEESAGKVVKLWWRLLRNNPDVYFGTRAHTFMAVLGLSSFTWRLSDHLHHSVAATDLTFYNLGIWRPVSWLTPFTNWQSELLWNTVVAADKPQSTAGLLSRFGWSAWLQFLILLGAVLAHNRAPVTAALCAALLARIAGVFAFAPASHLFYVYDLYLFGLLVPLLFLAENRLRQGGAGVAVREVAHEPSRS